MGGNKLRSFLKATNLNKEFAGKSLAERVTYLRDKNLDSEQLHKLLGDSEAIDAFQIMARNSKEIESVRRQVAGANVSLVTQQLGMEKLSPTVQAAVLARQSRARAELSGEQTARTEMLSNAAVDQNVEAIRLGKRRMPLQAVFGDAAWTRETDAATYRLFMDGVGGVGMKNFRQSALLDAAAEAGENPDLSRAIRANRREREDFEGMKQAADNMIKASESMLKAAEKQSSVRPGATPRFNWPAAARADAAAEAK